VFNGKKIWVAPSVVEKEQERNRGKGGEEEGGSYLSVKDPWARDLKERERRKIQQPRGPRKRKFQEPRVLKSREKHARIAVPQNNNSPPKTQLRIRNR